MRASADRVAYQWLISRRPVPIDKGEIRQAIKQVLRMLPKVLRTVPADQPLWASGKRLGPWFVKDWDVVDMAGNAVSVGFWVTTVRKDGDPSFWAGGSVGWKGGTKVQMEARLNASRTPSELWEDLRRLERELYSTLIHEVTHLQDAYRPRPEMSHDDRPQEIRAYMQQVADEVVEHLLSGAKGAGARWFWLWRRKDKGRVTGGLLRQALQSSYTWGIRKHNLTPGNRKILLKGVATAVSDAEPLFAQAERDALARVR